MKRASITTMQVFHVYNPVLHTCFDSKLHIFHLMQRTCWSTSIAHGIAYAFSYTKHAATILLLTILLII